MPRTCRRTRGTETARCPSQRRTGGRPRRAQPCIRPAGAGGGGIGVTSHMPSRNGDALVQTGDSLRRLRVQRPLIHQITNFVVMNETANATLAIGALPVMAHAPEEVEEMAAVAGALVLNIGTLTTEWIESMILAGRAANAAGVPVVLDPVGVGATALRTRSAQRILDEVRVAVARGSAAGSAPRAGGGGETRGVNPTGAAGALGGLAGAAASAL